MATVLVIDDDPDVRAVIAELLTVGGHQVVLAANGDDGIEAQRRRAADIVLLDLFMPEKDGFETIDALAHVFPGLAIIAMSGGARGMDGSRYLTTADVLGATRVLPKPFNGARLLEVIADVLEPRRAW